MSTTADGRSTRWDEHRLHRRAELVDATLRAVRAHGAGVGMGEIAATAGTSKTVVYRHFTDRAGLYAAVAERVDANIARGLAQALADVDDGSTKDRARALVEAYLTLVERDPEVYRFILNPPDGAHDTPSRVARHLAGLASDAIGGSPRDRVLADLWGAALVGMLRESVDEWVRPDGAVAALTRPELTDHLTALLWGGLSSVRPVARRRR